MYTQLYLLKFDKIYYAFHQYLHLDHGQIRQHMSSWFHFTSKFIFEFIYHSTLLNKGINYILIVFTIRVRNIIYLVIQHFSSVTPALLASYLSLGLANTALEESPALN